jgi:hypothetical protein
VVDVEDRRIAIIINRINFVQITCRNGLTDI